MKLRGIHVVIFVVLVVVSLVVYGSLHSRLAPAPPEEPSSQDASLTKDLKAREPVQTSAGANLVIEPAEQLDFGTIPREGLTMRQIKLHNRGTDFVEIKKVHSSCGCTKVAILEAEKKIPPGGTSIVNVTADPKGIRRFVSKQTVTITSNDPLKPESRISVLARVDPEFELEPEELDLGELRKGAPIEKTILFRQLTDEPIEIKDLVRTKPGDDITLSFAKRPDNEWKNPGKNEYTITVRLAEDISPGDIKDTIAILSTCKRLPSFSYSIKGKITAFYKVTPPRGVMLRSPSPDGSPGVGIATVIADRPFELVDLKPTTDEMVVSSKPGPSPNSVALEIGLKPDAKPGRRNENIAFTVKSSEESLRDRLEVRIFVASGSEPGRPKPPPQQPTAQGAESLPPRPPVRPHLQQKAPSPADAAPKQPEAPAAG